MCGIAGYLSFHLPFQPKDEEGFHRCLHFRGPDHHGTRTLDEGAIQGRLYHYRLAILDLDARANQPMRSNSGHTDIVYNGEIYNYLEIKQELQREGFAFTTSSDTEVILCAYEYYGVEKLLDQLDGMFSFVLVDHRAGRVILARDPFGKKPLYYFHSPSMGQLVFSSDIRSFEAAGIALHTDPVALSYYLCELSTPELHSIYTEVKKVQPGSYMEWTASGLTHKKYWHLDYSRKIKLSRVEIIEECERLLENAVKKRLISDVGVGAFLSGGIDSSLVVAMMARHSHTPVRTYTVGFSDRRFDESAYARKVAEKWNTDHYELRLDEMDPALMERILEECGEPFADSSVFPSYLVCHAISGREKVALSGDGGDELFGGYYEYYFASRLDKYRNRKFALRGLQALGRVGMKNRFTRFADELFKQGFDIEGPELLHRTTMGFHPDEVKDLLQPAYFSDPRGEFARIWNTNSEKAATILDRVMAGSLHTRLVNDYLVKTDRASMMNSLEVRSPFLDRELAKFTASIPGDQLIYKGIPKSITKAIAEKYLPREDIHRQKMGFGVPIGEWFRGPLRPQLEKLAGDPPDFLRKNPVKKVINSHFEGINRTDKLVTLFALQKWLSFRRE